MRTTKRQRTWTLIKRLVITRLPTYDLPTTDYLYYYLIHPTIQLPQAAQTALAILQPSASAATRGEHETALQDQVDRAKDETSARMVANRLQFLIRHRREKERQKKDDEARQAEQEEKARRQQQEKDRRRQQEQEEEEEEHRRRSEQQADESLWKQQQQQKRVPVCP